MLETDIKFVVSALLSPFALNCFLLATVAVVSVCKYVKTRDGGLIWLAMGLVVWPAVMMALWVFANHTAGEQIQRGQMIWFRDMFSLTLVLPGLLLLHTKPVPQRS